MTAGGIAVQIDPITGFTGRGFSYSSGLATRHLISRHPDTNQSLLIEVPFWADIVREVTVIAQGLKSTPWLGFDVAVTPKSFFITEINSHTSIDVAQTFAPLRSNPAVRELFPGP